MRAPVHIAAVFAFVVAALACGNLENAPFRTGTIRGQLTEWDSQLAWVSLVGDPSVRGEVDAEGAFVLERVPAGPAELFVVATSEKATRVKVNVPGGQSVTVEKLTPRLAGFFDLRVKATRGGSVDAARVTVEGTPFQLLSLDSQGRLRLGPLPDGCYTLSVLAPDLPAATTEACVGMGEKKEVKVDLKLGDPAPGPDCRATGCASGLVCDASGECVECHEDAQCGNGLTCHDARCEAPSATCAPCKGDWQCRDDARCLPQPEGGTACVAACDNENTCAQGFACQEGQCRPDTSQFASCHAFLLLGSGCDGDARCREQGLLNGLCVEGSCTVPCTANRDCPAPLKCGRSAAGRVCRPAD
ncbi:carboxypeptidase regulatory-like domain-containing protein [Corallococcus sp. H22C18031201]|uniref:carboxypeptidase regulatory-like domain-containing protein n=1 Tax=Citreicoccus inhibens TaxID=2849499 RepID=UPI000E70F970|nr:carboxypeptidase regulatory-like domain-containing protein [Citreicoccus inhibens]MBU8897601.1 carboxypeptidase regulatory-like domain-containing protein [Citreicoccus inhibens]RJS19281.1 carboxypeptidase regulatory-like domain-containing protein [Corallococcus sp. H22C18031201]